MIDRVFLVVADSMGVGAAPDAVNFLNGGGNDEGSDTFGALLGFGGFSAPNLEKLGICNIDGVDDIYRRGRTENPCAAYGKMCEISAGKDTVTGHRELGGVISDRAMPTFPKGFPRKLLDEMSRRWGRGWICNKPYSGTDVIRDYGREHTDSGKLIVYTSADSVFQIAAHEEIVPVEELYRYCEIARELLTGTYAVGRVIARPFSGDHPFERTARRRDYALAAPCDTMCDELTAAGLDVIGVGKIGDIFAHRGISEEIHTVSNTDGMARTMELLDRDFHGLCFVNLVDFDMKYGHRRDVHGYAEAVMEFDRFIGEFAEKMSDGDCLIITADHGCDPTHIGTDHTREYVPILISGNRISAENIGVCRSFADLGKTVEALLGVKGGIRGESFADLIYRRDI